MVVYLSKQAYGGITPFKTKKRSTVYGIVLTIVDHDMLSLIDSVWICMGLIPRYNLRECARRL